MATIDVDFNSMKYEDNYIYIAASISYPIEQYGSVSFQNNLPTTSDEPNGVVKFQLGLTKGVFFFKNVEYVVFVDNSLIFKLKDRQENFLLIKNIPYEEYEKSREAFRSWGIEVRN
ncbi:hypothetical protein [Bartonella sp. HY038]|uniref:hypothetical protein n=1 Tax=Bartonella sp. HY038 TaxID=2759660 RepID=UPI0015FB8E5A|nr:hypothetical protein [Bartonella sp. HY038]